MFSPPLCLYRLAEDLAKRPICLSLTKLPVYRRWGKSSQSSSSPGEAFLFLVLTDEIRAFTQATCSISSPSGYRNYVSVSYTCD